MVASHTLNKANKYTQTGDDGISIIACLVSTAAVVLGSCLGLLGQAVFANTFIVELSLVNEIPIT